MTERKLYGLHVYVIYQNGTICVARNLWVR